MFWQHVIFQLFAREDESKCGFPRQFNDINYSVENQFKLLPFNKKKTLQWIIFKINFLLKSMSTHKAKS